MQRNETGLHAPNIFTMVEKTKTKKKEMSTTACRPSAAQLEKEKKINIFARISQPHARSKVIVLKKTVLDLKI
jgi:hypothetical protein